ncbi:MAG: Fe-S cluster assembly protein SufD [Kiritimatiellia bacterium]|jgi:Fe-S cluster assembly protein SufD
MSAIMTPTHFMDGFDEAVFNTVSQGEAPFIRARREKAFSDYGMIPNPTNRDEEYRRTDPMTFRFGRYTRMANVATGSLQKTRRWSEGFDVVVSITDKRMGISDQLPAGVTVCSLNDAATSHPELLKKYFMGPASPEEDRKFLQLNNAFWNAGLLIHVAKGVVLEKGILIHYDVETTDAALLPRLLVIGEEQSQFSIIEDYQSDHETPFLCCSAREFYAHAGANVKLVTIQEWGPAAVHLGEDWARVDRDATVDLVTMSLGGKVSKMSVGCNVCEPNANAYLGGLYFANDKQHFDQKTLQLHSAPNTYSNMLYKGAAKDKGYSVYQGVIQATHGSIGVDAYQTNNNLILDNGARADSLPGLIINADELACSHGATMGNLDQEQIHYLRTRGIDEIQARKMLVLGFFEEVVQRVPYLPIQDRLHDMIENKLGFNSHE